MSQNIKNLSYMAVINNLSYGIVGINFLKHLSKHLKVSLFPISENIEAEYKYHGIIKESLSNSQLFDPDAPCLRIFHQNNMSTRIGRGKFYGMPIFELNGFSKIEQHHLSQLDHIIVNSKWAKSIVEGNVQVPCDVVPLGVDIDIFTPSDYIPKKTTFLNIGKMEYRKGHDVIIECFNKAFTKNDDVELWLMWNNDFPNCNKEKWKKLVTNSPLSSKIKQLLKQSSSVNVAEIINMSTCGIYPTRAEGFGLPILETMACGKPVITTNYSGHTEFCNEDNSDLIDISLEPAKDDEWPHFDGVFEWGHISNDKKDEIISCMRKHHKTHIKNTNGITTAKEFSWEKSTGKLIELLS